MQSWMIGLVSGIVFAGFCPVLPPWYLSALLAGLAILAITWRSVVGRLLCGVLCGSFLQLAYGTVLLHERLADECVGIPLVLTGRVSSLPGKTQMQRDVLRQRFSFSVEDLMPKRCAGPATLMLSYYGDHELKPGEEWQFEVKLRKPWGLANPGSFNMQAWFAQEGIDGVGTVRVSPRTKRLSVPHGVYAMHHRARLKISERIERLGLAPDVAAILRAITVADKGDINPRLWFLFQQFGINHLLVISGLHVGMVAGVGYILGGICQRGVQTLRFKGTWMPGVFALFLACLYAALAGFSLPTQRALSMLACFVIARLAGRKSGAPNNLLLAATGVLILNPLAAVGSGFWLSFGAVAALLWLARWQQGIGKVRLLLSTHVYMALVMLPLGALFFGGSSLVAMVANIVMIPLIGWVVVPLGLMAVVSFLCGWPLEAALWKLAGWPLEQLLPVAADLAQKGGSLLYLPLSAGLPQALLGLVAIALLIMPGGVLFKLLALMLTLPIFLPAKTPSSVAPLQTRVTVLDVGQGTAVVVRSGARALLYDTGGGDPQGVNMGSMVVLPFLREQGIAALDSLVISHPDQDHSAGAELIRDSMHIARFRYGGDSPGGGGGRPCIAGESWRWPGGQQFQFLSPARETPLGSNDSSCVLQIQVGDYRFLLPGDIEERRERTLVQYWGSKMGSDWLLGGHHGSRTSTSLTFLKNVQPEIAVISSGYANRFGHPHPTVMERFHHRGVHVFSTATEGALTFDLVPGEALRIEAYRRRVRRYWM